MTERNSPDGRYIATVFERNCGATTDYVTAINIRPSDEPFDDGARHDVLSISGLPPVKVEWAAPRALVIQLPTLLGKERLYGQSLFWRDVKITYRHVSRQSASDQISSPRP
jgi:hypothetical protein